MFSPSASRMKSSATSRMRTQVRPSAASVAKGSATSSAATASAMSQRCARGVIAAVRSRPLAACLAHQARGPEDEDEHQHEEGEHVAVVAAEHPAGEIADVAGCEA